ncbi:LPXTG-motif protein cell wall anchor domain protein [Gardnerella vaginalis JCP8070]|nr:LPXTG-motif protein cell wall anchor domain protein [Gardnerella vaginalis JCP8070]
MLSKKAIAAFAAVATFVSGIAFAMPALANSATAVQTNSGGESAKHPSVAKLENRVKNSGLLKSEIDELLKYVSKNDSKVTGSGDANNAVVKYVDDKIVEYRARHLDVIGLHDLAKQVREADSFKSAFDIFFGVNGKPATKDDRDKAQSAYNNGKAALVKKAEDEGLTLAANKIKESNYSSLSSLENLLNEAEKYAKEDLVKQAKAKKFNFTATLMSKAATLNGARALLNEAQKTITDSAIKGMVDLGTSEEEFLANLKKAGKTATPSQIEFFRKELQKRRDGQEKSYTNAVELAQLVNTGMFTATSNEKAAIAQFLEVVKNFGNKTFKQFNNAEANQAGAAAVNFNNKISAGLKNAIKNYKEEKEKLAKQADDQGFHFIANLIRKSKKSRLLYLENLLAEAKKSKNSEREKNPGASGDVLPDKSEEKPADKPAEKAPSAPSAPSASDSNATQDSSVNPGLAKPESSEKPSQTKAVVPSAPASVDQLKPELKGTLKVGSNNIAVAGSANKVSVNVNNKAFLNRLHREGSAKAYAFMYSTPKLLRSVDGSDYVTVKLGADGVPYFDAQFPAGYSGKHTVVLVDEDGNQLAWTDITVANNATGQGDGRDVLPVTGVAGVLVAFAALMFAASGAVLRKVRS